MPRLSVIALAPIALALSGCVTMVDPNAGASAIAELKFTDDAAAGTVRFYRIRDEVQVLAILTGIEQGTHAVHLHTTGSCEGPNFTSAGGHLNPGGMQHGTSNPAGPHMGDLPNVEISGRGTGSFTAVLRGNADQVMNALLDADGSAVVVHEDEDDYLTDPTGNAGSRIACGVVRAL